MFFYESSSTNPYYNLALEEYFFERMDRSQAYFLLWQNHNTIVVGKYQNTAEEINREYVDAQDIRVVRRLSGGGAVYHDKGNLNYTFIVNQSEKSNLDFKSFVEPVIKTLDSIGIKASFTGRNDLTIDGKKFSGNSQHMKSGRLLHHGCIMLDTNLTSVKDALKPKDAKFNSKGIKSVRSNITTINDNAPNPISMDQFKNLLRANILDSGQMQSVELNQQQCDEINQLKEQKYDTWDWNYGLSPYYDVKKTMRFASGIVTAYFNVEKSCIESIKLHGDFFGNGDITELEEALISVPLNENLGSKLNSLNVSDYLLGISANDLYALLMY